MRRLRVLLGAAVACVALGAPVAAAQDKQPTATGSGGAAASVDPLATNAAIDVLRKGGNAFDAAIAAASVLGVVEPYSCGIGGGGFMTIRDGRSGRITTLDSRETAPQGIRPDSFMENGVARPFSVNRYSGLSVGVPGTPALWEYVLRRYGRFSLARALSYGASVARNGFTVDQTFFDQTTPNAPYFDDVPSTAAIYLDADGTARDVGTTIRNPDLAKTYELLARKGVERGFYDGDLAAAIVSASDHPPLAPTADHTWLPGVMTAQDMKAYRVIPRDPVRLGYRGNDIYGMAPPSSGGTTDLEALNILQQGKQPADRTEALYRYLEASRLAYADRNAYLGDPAFVTNPVQGLLDDGYAAQRAALIPPTAPTGPVAPGTPPGVPAPAGSGASVDRIGSTTHLSVADRWGNIVAYTFTIEQTGGDGIVVPGYGFLLNNELTDFDVGSTTAPNSAAPGKRPRSSIAPTIVLRGGRPFMTVGSPGGASIITTVLQILLDRIDFGMSLPQAIAAPRASQRNGVTTDAEPAFETSPEGLRLVSQYGEKWTVPVVNEIGAATGIEFLGRARASGGPHRDGHGGHGDHNHGHGGLQFLAAAEPVRRGGGSAAVVRPGR